MCRVPELSPCSKSMDPEFAVINHTTSGSELVLIVVLFEQLKCAVRTKNYINVHNT